MSPTLYESINYLLDTTYMLCSEIAETLKCDIEDVNSIVHARFLKRIGE